MDFDSPDVEKEFPGLYASETGKKDDDECKFFLHTAPQTHPFLTQPPIQLAKAIMKKSAKKNCCLADAKIKKTKRIVATPLWTEKVHPTKMLAIQSESIFFFGSLTLTIIIFLHIPKRSPSKSTKKSKAFKFPTSKGSKEKREKSRDKHLTEAAAVSVVAADNSASTSAATAAAALGSPSVLSMNTPLDTASNVAAVVAATSTTIGSTAATKEKKKDKDKKEKADKKEKVKDKDKKDKKSKQSSVSEEILELGDAQPIFGVGLGLAVQRSRCHDHVALPLVVRDCIDFLQEHGLASELIYKVDAVKTKVQALKRSYNNREGGEGDEFDVPVACSLFKLFFKLVLPHHLYDCNFYCKLYLIV